MSGETLEENEAGENALAEVEKVKSDLESLKSEEPVADAHVENEVGKTVEVENEKPQETNSEEGEEKALTDLDGENAKPSETNGDHMLYEDAFRSGDDEEDDWGYNDGEGDDDEDDDSEDEEEIAFDEDEASEEEAAEGGDDEDNSDGDGEETALAEDGVSEGKAIEKEDDVENAEAGKEIAKEDVEVAEEHNAEKADVNLKEKKKKKTNVKKSKGQGEMNKLGDESSQKLAQGEKSKSSLKKNSNKKVESMGMIFMCSSKTKSDCFKYKVLGLPESKKSVVEKIYSGMRLFLYDVDLKLMYGIYKAQGPGGYNIVGKAFKSKFPSQVRFSVLRDCLPLAEEKFKKVIKENYFTNKKFDGQLNSEQVKKLCKMFVSLSKGTPTKRFPRSRKAEKQPIPVRRESRMAEKQPIPVRQESKRKQRADERKRPPLREKDRHTERPPKRPRRAISPVSRSHQLLPSSAPLIALDRNLDVDPYRRNLYIDSRGRDRDHYRRDHYESRRDRPIEYREERDLYLERRDPHRDGRDPYLDRRDPYRDGRDLYLDRRAPVTETRDPYTDRRIRYRDEPDPYPVPRDPYRDAQDVYIPRAVYKDVREPEPYDPYRREPLPDSRVVYREDRGVAYRDPYRLEEALDRPVSLETRRRYDVVGQDPYVSYRAIPSTTLPLYSAEYTSRGLTREYRL